MSEESDRKDHKKVETVGEKMKKVFGPFSFGSLMSWCFKIGVIIGLAMLIRYVAFLKVGDADYANAGAFAFLAFSCFRIFTLSKSNY
ncbi:MAG: hypothetical protein GY793_10975 [Proteobacteria bacterium]|nr:hypothetical protein [Pseudomonadota bacterium]